jgi:hypothetical protein
VVTVPLSLLAVIVDCRDPRRQAEWWAHALAYQVSQRNPDEFLVSDPAGAGGTLYFMKGSGAQGGQEPAAPGRGDVRLDGG